MKYTSLSGPNKTIKELFISLGLCRTQLLGLTHNAPLKVVSRTFALTLYKTLSRAVVQLKLDFSDAFMNGECFLCLI